MLNLVTDVHTCENLNIFSVRRVWRY